MSKNTRFQFRKSLHLLCAAVCLWGKLSTGNCQCIVKGRAQCLQSMEVVNLTGHHNTPTYNGYLTTQPCIGEPDHENSRTTPRVHSTVTAPAPLHSQKCFAYVQNLSLATHSTHLPDTVCTSLPSYN